MLASIYYCVTWACNRSCVHCYDGRFRPYPSGELAEMLARQAVQVRKIIRHLPDRLSFLDLAAQLPDGTFPERPGRVVLAGGEVLLPEVREKLLYPCLKELRDKYGETVRTVVQTAGDLLDGRLLDELLDRGVWMVSVSSMDGYHHGGDDRGEQLRDRLTKLFGQAGMEPSGTSAESNEQTEQAGGVYEFLGATPDAWIGRLWPSGRAWENCLSTAQCADNFCNRWSGGLGFLALHCAGSEVAIDPEGKVHPCCRKTAVPYGDLTHERLADILESLVGVPPFEALTCGAPERMGISFGISPADFRKLCVTHTPRGEVFVNPCIGCDRIHREHLKDLLEQIYRERAGKNHHGSR